MSQNFEKRPITDFGDLPDKVIGLIRDLQSDADIWKRRDAAFALEKYTQTEVTRALIEVALTEQDSNILEGVAVALGNHPRSAMLLTSLVHIRDMQGDKYRWSRGRAQESLKKLNK